ncbi:hypothetical protein ACQP10_38220 (plasmid) [Streptosporangium sandarakinum]|uniref:hypothetical protein n=1 Tax=Streptosporangium sandarakinum TaxID=1260955 RepID=UPI003D936B1F
MNDQHTPADDIQAYEITDDKGMPLDMTWGDLLKVAAKQPRTAKVVLASDREGNSFHPLHMVGVNAFFIRDPSPYGDEHEVTGKPRPDGAPCIVLWPSS